MEEMDLTPVEADFLGDLAEDVHGIWEVFETVRGHYPGWTDSTVFLVGRQLLESWVRRGWLVVSHAPLYPSSITSLEAALRRLDELGAESTRYFEDAPSIDLAGRAREEVPWLRR